MAHTVTLAQIQHYQMTQHGLAQRVRAFDASAHLPLHATLSTTPYLSLLARVEGFAGTDADAEAAPWWSVLHAPASPSFALRRCMRGTLHLVPRTLLAEIVSVYGEKAAVDEEEVGTKKKGKNNTKKDKKMKDEDEEDEDEEGSEEEGDKEEEEEVEEEKKTSKFRVLNFYKIPQKEAEQVGEQIMVAIKKHGPQTSVTIKKHLSKKLIKKREGGWGTVCNIGPIMKYLNQTGRLEYGVPASADIKKKTTWRNKVRLFGINTLKNKIELIKKELAMAEIAKWYFKLYGPAAFEDFVWWSGLSVGFCRGAFDLMKGDLIEVKSDGIAETLYMYKNQVTALLQSPKKPPTMARLLPYEDALIKAYKATRHRFFGKHPAPKIITKGGEARPTVWVDGQIVGVWKWTNKPGHDISITLFDEATDAAEDPEEEEKEEKATEKGKGKGKGKARAKASKKKEDPKKALKERLAEELKIVSKFIEAENVIWE